MSNLLEAIEIQTTPDPDAAVIWLHGLGADGNDFVPVVPELGLEGLGVRFVFPHAPMRPVTVNGGMVMRAWYDIYDVDIGREDEAGVRTSQSHVQALIEREIRRGIGASRLVLAGFSQGGAIALHTGLRTPQRLAGILALSCYLPLGDSLAAEQAPDARSVPIFMAHGTADPIVPFVKSVQSRKYLERLGYTVEWHDYPMPHSVCMEEIRDVSLWLRQVLA
jgi:phospholipase/carboxylesterase